MNVTVDGVEVDMDASQVGISYAIGDPLEPGTIAGTRSTTFKMPATNRVRAAMGGVSMNERPITGDPILRIGNGGNVYLEQKVRPIEWDEDEVRSVTVGNNAGWIADLKNLKLPDLPLGESPRITREFMQDTWTNEDELLYFPLIDYGYGWIAGITAEVENLRPGLRCHRILKAAFAELGYSLRVTGRLASVWKKYVLPCTEEVKVGDRYLDENRMELTENTLQVVNYSGFIDTDTLPPGVDVVVDPGGNNTGTFFYTAPLAMEVEAFFSLSYAPIGIDTNGKLYFWVYDVGTGLHVSNTTVLNVNAAESIPLTSLGIFNLSAGQQVGLRVTDNASLIMDMQVTQCSFIIQPTNIEYQENVTVNIPQCAPNISPWDVLQGINYSRLLAFDTDDRTKVVTISYDEDKYRPISEGISLVGREDFTDKPVKGNPLRAKRIVWKWKEDGNDVQLKDINRYIGQRGWGGLIRDVAGGTLKDKEIEMPFSATTMYGYVGGVFIPAMRETYLSGTDQPTFKWDARLLLADGVTDGEWTFGGDAFTTYPKCFFVFPGDTELTMAFGPETFFGDSGPGTVALHYGPYLRRLEKSFTYSIDLMLYDHEMKGLDFGVPVEVRDKFGTGWYYFTEIKRKQFGKDVPTRCELIQV